MNNLTGFMKWLEFKDITLVIRDGKLAFINTGIQPDEQTLLEVKANKNAITDYLTLDVDRTSPCQSSLSGCIHSLPTFGCMHAKHKDLMDRYREDCTNCQGYTALSRTKN